MNEWFTANPVRGRDSYLNCLRARDEVYPELVTNRRHIETDNFFKVINLPNGHDLDCERKPEYPKRICKLHTQRPTLC